MSLIHIVSDKIQRGERLSDEDALGLYESADLLAIGALADQVNRSRNKDHVFFNVNRHINPTNICALSCKFCAYSRKPGEEGAYAYSIEEMVVKAGEAVAQGATEVHMVGGLHPRWSFSHYKDMIAAVKTAFPDLHIKAFTAVELDWLARRARKTTLEILTELREVGLGSLPGGGAEIFHPEIRDAICDTKVSAERWLDIHRQAHSLGMRSNCTMLYGHIEKYSHRVDHMRRLRELQDETHGFNAFIPLSFQPFQNEMGIDRYTFGYDDLKNIAIARLYLDNFQHIKAYWVMLGQDVAQLALQYGANDLDGTVIEEKISRMAGGRAGMAMGRQFIESIVRKAQRIPQERDTLYNAVTRPGRPETRSGASANQSQTHQTADGLRSLTNKLDYDAVLTEEELSLVATNTAPHELGRIASQKRDHITNGLDASFAYTVVPPLDKLRSAREVLAHVQDLSTSCLEKFKQAPTTIVFDLFTYLQPPTTVTENSLDDAHLADLIEMIWRVKQGHPEAEISVWGFKGLWTLAQQEQVSIAELAARLREAGVCCVESSPHETETDLTHSEIIDIHKQLHRCEIATIAKVELIAPAQGNGDPLWEDFVRRCRAFATLAHKNGGLFKGLSIVASPASFVTTTEYMRAIAIARLAAHGIVNIIAPLSQMPTMSPVMGLGSSEQHQPAEKIGAVALHYGANDLGHVTAGHLNPTATMQQIRSAGYRPVLRDAALSGPEPYGFVKDFESDNQAPTVSLRHVPELRV